MLNFFTLKYLFYYLLLLTFIFLSKNLVSIKIFNIFNR